MELQYEDVVEILRLIDESAAHEIELAYGDLKLVVRKRAPGTEPQPAPVATTTGAAAPAAAPAAKAGAVTTAVPAPAPAGDTHGGTDGVASSLLAAAPAGGAAPTRDSLVPVTAPMMGTFYRAPAPDAPPFVEVGGEVAVDTALCIIEVMKVMNTLKSPVAGTVREICVPNATLVGYGQALMWIAPAGPQG